jgi:hypothetical protein
MVLADASGEDWLDGCGPALTLVGHRAQEPRVEALLLLRSRQRRSGGSSSGFGTPLGLCVQVFGFLPRTKPVDVV